MTVRELIEKLEKWPADAVVGCRAACCGHIHDIHDVRKPEGHIEEGDGLNVVIDAVE